MIPSPSARHEVVASHESTATLIASPPQKASATTTSNTTNSAATRRPSPDEVLGQMASKYGYGLPMGRYYK
ncbi:hypothetical protein EWM64_g4833 [Hericium alpestre]|uniref:Uncharacterized protein n=1 Tax=Hericium alpestre TaxID=135208 RepID=A0A4Y9ZYL2_9AGAM|nr:hypothetical protein EWM64_g4833 [Hericium alpestre]